MVVTPVHREVSAEEGVVGKAGVEWCSGGEMVIPCRQDEVGRFSLFDDDEGIGREGGVACLLAWGVLEGSGGG